MHDDIEGQVSWAAEHLAFHDDDPEGMSTRELVHYHEENCSYCKNR